MHLLRGLRGRAARRHLPQLRRQFRAAPDPAGASPGEISGLDGEEGALIPRILIIAGSDSGGGAGIQADIKTVTMLGGHAMTAVTAITVQNTLGVEDVLPLPLEIVAAQVRAVLSDIGADAIKIGMLGTPDLVRTVRDVLPAGIPVVLDPVMVATSGDALNQAGTGEALLELAGTAALVTPNGPELAALTGRPVTDEASMAAAASALVSRFHGPVLAKGGHLPGEEIVDLLVGADGVARRWAGPRIHTSSTHGTGCTLASGIATGLGAGLGMEAAIGRARDYVRAALGAAPGFGAGHGPMGHALGAVPFELIHRKEN
jgi:hydroxymethylpyrimidine/phosphomethylpyrimidine kinase